MMNTVIRLFISASPENSGFKDRNQSNWWLACSYGPNAGVMCGEVQSNTKTKVVIDAIETPDSFFNQKKINR
jgi:hypothetical protein